MGRGRELGKRMRRIHFLLSSFKNIKHKKRERERKKREKSDKFSDAWDEVNLAALN